MTSDSDATLPPDENADSHVASEDAETLIPSSSAGSGSSAAGDRVKYFGEYELLDEIARGGMGVVFKARQVKLNRIVALKMILSGELAGEEEVQRFKTEAEAAANLDHAGIVPIYEIGEHNGQHYFSMGFVEGRSLADRVRDGPLPPREAAEIVTKVAEAVAYAHEKGVIHRDLKPANILLDANGEPRVTDFGLAKQVESDSDLTRTGAVMGTPSYMPPEQAGGKTEEVGPPADIYALGAILYCLLTGRPPFQSANPMDILMQVLEKEPVSPRSLNSATPKDLETICLKCLEKAPARRYQSSEELVAELNRFLGGEPILARRAGRVERVWRWCRRKPAIALLSLLTAALLIALGIGGPIAAWQQSSLRTQADTEAQKAREAQEQTEVTLARSYLFLATARWEANRVLDALDFLDRVPPKHRNIEWYLARHRFRGSDVTCYGHQGPVRSVAYSTDGMHVASGSDDGTVRLWDSVTGTQVSVLRGHNNVSVLRGHNNAVHAVAFSPDGQLLASGGLDDKIRLWNVRTGKEVRVLGPYRGGVLTVAFSPDGKHVAGAGGTGIFKPGENDVVQIWSTETGELVETLRGHTQGINSIAYDPSGEVLASVGYDGTVRLWETTSGMAKTVLAYDGQLATDSLAFSSDGTSIVAGGADHIEIWDVDSGEHVRSISKPSATVVRLAFHPTEAVVASCSDASTITLWNADTGEETMRFRSFSTFCLAFSPDGARLASANGNTLQLWDTRIGTSALQQQLVEDDQHWVSSLLYGPDSEQLVIGSLDQPVVGVWSTTTGRYRTFTGDGQQTGIASLWLGGGGNQVVSAGTSDGSQHWWDLATGELKRTLTLDDDEPINSLVLSPDGTRIVSASRNHRLRVWDAESGEGLLTLESKGDRYLFRNADTPIVFRADGRSVVTADGTAGSVSIWDVDSGKIIRSFADANMGKLALSPDGDRLATDTNGITIWDIDSGQRVAHCAAGKIAGLTFNADGTRIISAGNYSNRLRVWDALTGEELFSFEAGTNDVFSLACSPDGTWLASGCAGQVVNVWNAGPDEVERVLRGHANVVSGMAFSDDGSRIASFSADRTIRVWDTETGANQVTIQTGKSAIQGVTFSPNGSRVHGRIWNGHLSWDTVTGEPVEDSADPPDFTTDRTSSPDGRWLVVPSSNRILLIDQVERTSPRRLTYLRAKAGQPAE